MMKVRGESAIFSLFVLMIKMWARVIISALRIDNLRGKTYFLLLIFLVKNKANESEIIENIKKYVKSVINKNLNKISVCF